LLGKIFHNPKPFKLNFLLRSMAYGFCYSDNSTIYVEVGLDSINEAKKSLENIAFIFCNKKEKQANGRIDEIKDKELFTLEKYSIDYKYNDIILKRV